MKMRRVIITAALAAMLGAGSAHAGPGGILGSGGATTGCSGGQLGITGQNPSGVEWVFEVGVWCPTSLSEVVIATGNWNPATGGSVTGLSFGTLVIGKVVNCGSNPNVLVQAQMPGAGWIQATASITRFCS